MNECQRPPNSGGTTASATRGLLVEEMFQLLRTTVVDCIGGKKNEAVSGQNGGQREREEREMMDRAGEPREDDLAISIPWHSCGDRKVHQLLLLDIRLALPVQQMGRSDSRSGFRPASISCFPKVNAVSRHKAVTRSWAPSGFIECLALDPRHAGDSEEPREARRILP